MLFEIRVVRFHDAVLRERTIVEAVIALVIESGNGVAVSLGSAVAVVNDGTVDKKATLSFVHSSKSAFQAPP